MATNISAELTSAQLTAILDNLDEVRDALDFLVSLSNEQRQRLFKAGATRSGAIPIAQQIATQFPEILPGTFPIAELNKDILLRTPLQSIRTELGSLTSAVDDTLLALNAECMKHVLEVYKYSKAAQNTVPGIKPLVEQLAVYFDRPSHPDATDTPATPAA